MTLLIHPGFHKTGTTWLQTEVFSDARLWNAVFDHWDVDSLIVRPHDFRFDPDLARAELAARASAPGSGLIDVISSETLVGSPFFGWRDAATIANRLHAIAPDARILFTVRAQKAMMRSLYQQYLKRGGTLKPDPFFNQRCEPNFFGFDTSLLELDLFVAHYARLFGHDNVCVLPQELLHRDPDAFFDAMVRFASGKAPPAGVTVSNRRGAGLSPPHGGTPLFRMANRLRRTPMLPAGFGGLAKLGDFMYKLGYRQHAFSGRYARQVENAIKSVPHEKFAAANAKLQAWCPVDLAALGYY